MESRFRVRFWSTKRVKAPTNTDLDLHSVPYQTAPSSDKQPIFIHQSLGRNLSEKRKSNTFAPLRAFAYGETAAGKAPTFGARPQPGNGPVKLQTNRMLSSGELLETSQNSERTLEDIREGGYIVPGKDGKDRRDSRSVKSSVPSSPLFQSPSFAFASTTPQISSLQASLNSISSPLLDIPENAIVYDQPSAIPPQSQQLSHAPSRPRSRKQANASPNSSAEGLGMSEAPPLPVSILKKESKISLLEPHEEQNPTIRALWKAEYGRLVQLYGQDGVDRNIVDLRRDSKLAPSEYRRSGDEPVPPFTLDPLPRPSTEHLDGPNTTRLSAMSHHDDTSDESSKRLSHVSSAAYSSYTSGTSIAESETAISRADIRKMVNDMRSTYLQALETREPSVHAVKSMKKKRKARKSTTPIGTPRAGSFVRSTLGQQMPESPPVPKSPLPDSISPTFPTQGGFQTGLQSDTSVVGLQAIEASPSRSKEPEPGLKRADSATLGQIMGEAKRGSIRRRRSKRHSRKVSTQSKSRDISPKNQKAVKADPALDTDIANMYSDIFNTSHDFWQSSPTIAPTINISSSLDTSSTILSTSTTGSPMKKAALLL